MCYSSSSSHFETCAYCISSFNVNTVNMEMLIENMWKERKTNKSYFWYQWQCHSHISPRILGHIIFLHGVMFGSRACIETRDVSMEYKQYQSGDRYRINEKDECIWKWNWWRRWMHHDQTRNHDLEEVDPRSWPRDSDLVSTLPGINKVPWCYLILSKDQKL